MKLFLFLALSFIFLSSRVAAQNTDSLPENYKAALSVYHSLLKPETGLYRGNEYLNYRNSIQEGTPFFDPVPFDTGSVIYHDIHYENISIAYDVVKDEVVIFDPPRLHMLSLIKDEVSRFTSSGYTFIHLTKDSAGAGRMSSGFYRILYSGKIRILKRETRVVQEMITQQGALTRYITSSSNYFVQKDGAYHSVYNKSSILAVLNDKGKGLQQFIRKNKLKFRKKSDSDFAQTGAFYDALTK